MRVRDMDGIKVSSPKYISNVVTTDKKAEPQNTMPEKDMCDDVNISEKGKALLAADRELLEKFRQQRLFDTFGDMKDIKEIPEEYKRENLFKIKLEADSIFGGVNLFQENLTRQYEVFEDWLDKNASEMTEEQLLAAKDEIKKATGVMDFLNDQEGYRGTTFESVALLEASKSYLENMKNTMLPEAMRDGFQSMIDEYAYFNETSRDSLMQRLTLAYKVVGIGTDNQSYIYRDEMIQERQSFYGEKKADFEKKYADYYSGKIGKEEFMKDLRNYVTSFYKEYNSSTAAKATVDADTEDLLNKLANLLQ